MTTSLITNISGQFQKAECSYSKPQETPQQNLCIKNPPPDDIIQTVSQNQLQHRKELVERSRRLRQVKRPPKATKSHRLDTFLAMMMDTAINLDKPSSHILNDNFKLIPSRDDTPQHIEEKQLVLDITKACFSSLSVSDKKGLPLFSKKIKDYIVNLEDDIKFAQKKISGLLSKNDDEISAASTLANLSTLISPENYESKPCNSSQTISTPFVEVAEKDTKQNIEDLSTPPEKSDLPVEKKSSSSTRTKQKKNKRKKPKNTVKEDKKPLHTSSSNTIESHILEKNNPSTDNVSQPTDADKNLAINLRLYKASNQAKEHPRISRWKTSDVNKIREFIDTRSDGTKFMRYADLNPEEIQEQHARHYVPGTERLLLDNDFRKRYAFPTNRGYGMLAQLSFNGIKTNGILYIGIDDNKIVFHKYFEDVQFSTSTKNWLVDNEESHQEEQHYKDEEWISNFDFVSELSDKGVFKFTYSKDHNICIYPLQAIHN